MRRASISAALASRICSSKLAKLCALIFVAASCASSSLLTRLEQSLHWESNTPRSGHLSAISQPFSHAASLQGASTPLRNRFLSDVSHTALRGVVVAGAGESV